MVSDCPLIMGGVLHKPADTVRRAARRLVYAGWVTYFDPQGPAHGRMWKATDRWGRQRGQGHTGGAAPSGYTQSHRCATSGWQFSGLTLPLMRTPETPPAPG